MVNLYFKKTQFVLACLFFSAISILGQVNIRGKVVDAQAKPLAGARVGIERYNLFALTNNDGTFLLTGAPTLGIRGVSAQFLPQIRAGILTYHLAESSPVKVSLLNSKGKSLFTQSTMHAAPGKYSIPYMENQAVKSAGILYIRLEIGSQVSLWRQVVLDQNRGTEVTKISEEETALSSQPSLRGKAIRKTAAGKEAVTFTLQGYIPQNIETDGFDLDMGTIVLLQEASGAVITIAMDLDSKPQSFGAILLETALREINRKPVRVDITKDSSAKDITVRIVDSTTHKSIKPSGFQISRNANGILIQAIDPVGAMYGMQEVGDLIALNGLAGVPEKILNPRFPFRAIKFNLPWSSYRKNESLQLHTQTMKDLKFWESFLDMMVENRFSALTLWNQHPFPYLIRATNFPKACSFTDAELTAWKTLFSGIFKMAKDRGIDTYLVHWNVFVSKGYHDNYGSSALIDENGTGGDCVNSATDDKYLKESVTQLINEYPDLTGIGVTLGEGMNNWTATQREEWLLRTVVAGMKAANRKIKFIHRAPMYSTSKEIEIATRKVIEEITDCIWPIEFEAKFNWSHAMSTPRLIKIHGGAPTTTYFDPMPKNYRLDWMIRNEDIFVLRWGQPDFIRQHIAMNGQEYVNGYFFGSETYYPAKDYIHVPGSPHITWKYAFERQWLWYKQMGRLLYDPAMPDKVFEMYFDRKFGKNVGAPMVKAFKLVGDAPLRFASMIDFTWDFTMYSEGFGDPGFVTLAKLMTVNPFDNNLYSPNTYAADSLAGKLIPAKVRPFKLADTLEQNSAQALAIVKGIIGVTPSLECEIMDVKAWAYYGSYFAKKLKAATLLKYYQASGKKNAADKTTAIALLEAAKVDWANLVSVTKPHHLNIPNIVTGGNFAWENYTGLVNADITAAQGM